MAKTADGFEVSIGMTLYDPYFDGKTFLVESIEQPYDWVNGKGVASCYYASKAKLDEFMNSEKNLCFVCDKYCEPLSASRGSFDSLCMWDGLIFRSTGNYGSGAFDPPGGEALQIVICDECMLKRKSRVGYFNDQNGKEQDWNGS